MGPGNMLTLQILTSYLPPWHVGDMLDFKVGDFDLTEWRVTGIFEVGPNRWNVSFMLVR